MPLQSSSLQTVHRGLLYCWYGPSRGDPYVDKSGEGSKGRFCSYVSRGTVAAADPGCSCHPVSWCIEGPLREGFGAVIHTSKPGPAASGACLTSMQQLPVTRRKHDIMSTMLSGVALQPGFSCSHS